MTNNCGQEAACTGCTGCCDGAQCLAGDENTSCGKNGEACRTCGAFAACTSQRCQALTGCGGPNNGPCRVFATSTSHTGDFGSVEAADQICQDLAVEAGLPGYYQAWLSSDAATGKSPANRFLTKSAGPYWLLDGTPIANNWSDLTDGSLTAPINIDETGSRLPSFQGIWTNTKFDGTLGNRGFESIGQEHTCQNWTSASCDAFGVPGSSSATSKDWTGDRIGIAGPCCTAFRLYCFQQR